jgi:GNAT superfamily N-acetyltransferase
MTGFSLRLAHPADAEAGARVHLECWREAYRGLIAAEKLEPLLADSESWVAIWRRQLAAAVPRWLAETTHGELVGFASAGPDRMAESLLGLELYAIYVRAAWHGKGVGQALLDAAIGDLACSVWVLEVNPRARAFYARNGFQPDGTREYDDLLGAWEVRLVRDAVEPR